MYEGETAESALCTTDFITLFQRAGAWKVISGGLHQKARFALFVSMKYALRRRANCLNINSTSRKLPVQCAPLFKPFGDRKLIDPFSGNNTPFRLAANLKFNYSRLGCNSKSWRDNLRFLSNSGDVHVTNLKFWNGVALKVSESNGTNGKGHLP